MTHGYYNRLGDRDDWTDLLTSGNAILEAVATDWVFGTAAPVIPPSSGFWRHNSDRRRRWRDDEEWLLLQ